MPRQARRRHATNWHERTVIEHVQKHGWHSTSAGYCAGDEGYPFAYTVGLFETWKHPELLVFNVPPQVAHGVFSLVAGFAAEGRPLDMERPTDELLENYPCVFVRIPPSACRDYVLSARWFYGGNDFPLYQLVWPSEEGYFPWHPDAPEAYLRSQPVLGQYAKTT